MVTIRLATFVCDGVSSSHVSVLYTKRMAHLVNDSFLGERRVLK